MHNNTTLSPSSPPTAPSYVVPDPDPIEHRNISELEYQLLFSSSSNSSGGQGAGEDLSFMHNDFHESNIIVDDDKIVGLVDWEMAGYFGWSRAGAVHSRCRVAKREDLSRFQLKEERLADLTYWNDLYEVSPSPGGDDG